MSKITIYQKPTCSTCRETVKLLKEKGIDFESINYIIDPPSASTIKTLLRKLKLRPIDIIRTKEDQWKALGLTGEESDATLIKALAENPTILQRPIIVKGERAVIARPPAKLEELFP